MKNQHRILLLICVIFSRKIGDFATEQFVAKRVKE